MRVTMLRCPRELGRGAAGRAWARTNGNRSRNVCDGTGLGDGPGNSRAYYARHGTLPQGVGGSSATVRRTPDRRESDYFPSGTGTSSGDGTEGSKPLKTIVRDDSPHHLNGVGVSCSMTDAGVGDVMAMSNTHLCWARATQIGNAIFYYVDGTPGSGSFTRARPILHLWTASRHLREI